MPAIPVILGVVFIILKLTEVIAWSWIWVLSPFWISALLGIIGIVIFLVFFKKITDTEPVRPLSTPSRNSTIWNDPRHFR